MEHDKSKVIWNAVEKPLVESVRADVLMISDICFPYNLDRDSRVSGLIYLHCMNMTTLLTLYYSRRPDPPKEHPKRNQLQRRADLSDPPEENSKRNQLLRRANLSDSPEEHLK